MTPETTATRAYVAVRTLGVMLSASGLLPLVWWLAAHPARDVLGALAGTERPPLPFVAALTGVCALALLGCAGWATAVVALAGCEALLASLGPPGGGVASRGRQVRVLRRARRCGRRMCPRWGRRLVLAACGVAIGTSAATPALADTAGDAARTRLTSASVVAGLPVPDRTVGGAGAPRQRAVTVTVEVGDSLWSLTKRLLGPDVGDAVLAHAWRELYRENRHAIGPDPDLIHPGTRLQVPDLVRHDRASQRRSISYRERKDHS